MTLDHQGLRAPNSAHRAYVIKQQSQGHHGPTAGRGAVRVVNPHEAPLFSIHIHTDQFLAPVSLALVE